MLVSNERYPLTKSVRAELPADTSTANGQSFTGFIDDAFRADVSERPVGTATISPGEKLTQFLLTQSIQAMLPKDETHTGMGFAGDVWRGMLAEKLSETLAHAIGSLVPEPGGAEVSEAVNMREVAQ